MFNELHKFIHLFKVNSKVNWESRHCVWFYTSLPSVSRQCLEHQNGHLVCYNPKPTISYEDPDKPKVAHHTKQAS